MATAAVVGSGEGVSRADSVVTAKGYACGYKMDVAISVGPNATRYKRGCDQNSADGTYSRTNEAADAESTEVGPETMLTTDEEYIDSFTTTDPLRQAWAAGLARIFTADTMESKIVGQGGQNWGATVSNKIGDINKTADYQEVFTADEVYSECKANPTDVVKRHTTVTNGYVYTDSGLDLNGDEDFDDAGEHGDETESVPTNPPAGHTINGHLHVVLANTGDYYTEDFTYTFNEHTVGTGKGLGLLTVYAAHLQLKGPNLANGDLWIGRADCGVAPPVPPTP